MSPGLLAGLVMVLALVSRPLDLWLWRRGKLSDRTAAVLLVGRFPAMVVAFGLIMGMSPVLLAVLVVPVLVIARLFYPFTRTLMDDPRAEQRRRKP